MKKILVVEDEADVRSTICDVLESENYNVISAKDGKEGYELALTEFPDMILSDVKMPNLTGFELLELLQKNPAFKNTPYLFLSAKVDLSDIRRGMALGADDYITKPFTVQDLLDAVALRLKKRSALMEDLEQLRISLVMRIPHELRTPLVGILGLSELLTEDLDSFSKDDIIEMTENINQTGRRLHNIIEKYIFYAGLLATESDTETRKNILTERHEVTAIEEYSRLLREIEKQHRIHDISVVMDSAIVAMSEQYFKALEKELVENAIKFSDDGTVVRIRGKVCHNNYELEIEDFGTGMPETSLEEIKSFQQFELNRYRYNGVGLGLATVKKIVEFTNSTLTIKSKHGGGTIVKVTIPLAADYSMGL